MQAKNYRADIDVLRAIAVLAVLFYHMHFPLFSGGYIGVSIFFVISGYLITGIIKRKLENNNFSFLEFYENRIRRILPALLVVILFTSFFYPLVATHDDYRYLMRTIKRTIFGLSNIFFYGNTNYFDPDAEQIPLLHTWSLGVEEQFYFIMPLFLFLLTKKVKKAIAAYIAAIFLLSFICSLFSIYYNEKFAFYMLPSRAWELLTGSFLAYTNWTPKTPKNKAVCILLGLLLMIVSIIFYGNNSYPGFWALIPCFGAALYIAGNTNYTFTNRFNLIHFITNNKLLIFIGVISYSLYLWHWVILLFYSYVKEFITETIYIKFALLLVIFLTSALSWKFIEQPVRRLPCFKNRKILWTSTLTIILTLFFTSSELRNIQYIEHIQHIQFGNSIQYTMTKHTTFYHSQENMPIDFIVIGDSHAEANTKLLQNLSQKYNCNGIYVVLTDVVNSFRQQKQGVNQIQEIKRLIVQHNIKTAFIIMRLAQEYDGKIAYYNENDKAEQFIYGPNPKLPPQEAFLQSLKDTVLLCKENGVKNIYIQMPLPEPKKHIPRYAFFSHLFYPLTEQEFNLKFQESINEYHARCNTVNTLLYTVEKEFPEVTLINPTSALLNKEKNHFLALKNNISYYYDDDHLSIEGAELLSPVYENCFKKMKENSPAK